MPKREVPMAQLQNYLPTGTFEPVLAYLRQYKVQLTIAKERKTVLGDYRHRCIEQGHRISVNGNLNKYSFLITLLHELAHLINYEQHGHAVLAHGKEWKRYYATFLKQFLDQKIFPVNVEKELLHSMHNPAASSCVETGLLRVLREFDTDKDKHQLLEDLPMMSVFKIADGRIFRKDEKLRKRFKCTELKTGKMYLFSPVYEVEGIKLTDN